VVHLPSGETTCIIDWKPERQQQSASTTKRDRWPKSLRVLRAALTTALIEHGKMIQPHSSEGLTVMAVPDSAVRQEFMASYPADAGGKTKGDAKRMAFSRALKKARDSGLIGSREIGGIDHLWLLQENEANTTRPNEHDTS
jgi:hypothetical protein